MENFKPGSPECRACPVWRCMRGPFAAVQCNWLQQLGLKLLYASRSSTGGQRPKARPHPASFLHPCTLCHPLPLQCRRAMSHGPPTLGDAPRAVQQEHNRHLRLAARRVLARCARAGAAGAPRQPPHCTLAGPAGTRVWCGQSHSNKAQTGALAVLGTATGAACGGTAGRAGKTQLGQAAASSIAHCTPQAASRCATCSPAASTSKRVGRCQGWDSFSMACRAA